jgi:hypothetical protein
MASAIADRPTKIGQPRSSDARSAPDANATCEEQFGALASFSFGD